jgi:hypothetical protein
MKRRYIAAFAIAIYAAAGLHPSVAVSWQIVSLVALAACVLLGAHAVDRYVDALDGVRVGAAEVDADDGGGS